MSERTSFERWVLRPLGFASMTGTIPHNEPHNEKRPQDAAPRDVHTAMPVRRTHAHLRRPLHAAPPRPATRPTHETAAHHAPVQDMTPIVAATGSHEQPNHTAQASVLQALNRAGRLTFDALLLIVFAPVIAVWWLNEKRRRRLTRD